MEQAGSRFPKAMRLSWNEVEDLLWGMAKTISREGCDPDVIIAVARGGLVPGRILADYLQKKYICSFQMGRWYDEATFSDTPRVVFPLPEVDLTGMRVLVVDDVSDEGCTMEGVVSYLGRKVASIRTAVVVSKADSRLKADFCAMSIEEWRWVLFPWSFHEDLLSFTEKVLQTTGGATAEDIVRILGEAMSVDIARHEIEKVLSDMQWAGEVKEDGDKVWTLI
jgi:hypoxanthine phosphoribosyltransferase